MFAKKTRIISLLLAVVLLLCPLQAASAETQKTPEEKIKRLLPVIERNPDGRFGIFVAISSRDSRFCAVCSTAALRISTRISDFRLRYSV